MKEVIWLGNSRERIRAFPEITKDIAGRELYRIQAGEMPTDWRPMPDIGSGVIEIRIHRPDEYRIFYIANYAEAVYILHTFQKKTQQTAEKDKQAGRVQYGELKKLRKERQEK
jgi:phage-related protein